MDQLATSFEITSPTIGRRRRLDGVTRGAPAPGRGWFSDVVRGGRRLLVDSAEIRPGDVVVLSRPGA